MVSTQTYIGTELKFALTITAEGFSMDDDWFSIELKRGGKSVVTIPKNECIHDGEGNWYFTFDSRDFGTGTVTAIITALVPDEDFDDNLRTEVTKIDLINIKNV